MGSIPLMVNQIFSYPWALSCFLAFLMRPEWSKQVLASLKLNFHQGYPKLIYGHFYCVKVQSIPSMADFELAIGMNLHAWHLHAGCCVSKLCPNSFSKSVQKPFKYQNVSKKRRDLWPKNVWHLNVPNSRPFFSHKFDKTWPIAKMYPKCVHTYFQIVYKKVF